jgi:hypothetical protein
VLGKVIPEMHQFVSLGEISITILRDPPPDSSLLQGVHIEGSSSIKAQESRHSFVVDISKLSQSVYFRIYSSFDFVWPNICVLSSGAIVIYGDTSLNIWNGSSGLQRLEMDEPLMQVFPVEKDKFVAVMESSVASFDTSGRKLYDRLLRDSVSDYSIDGSKLTLVLSDSQVEVIDL